MCDRRFDDEGVEFARAALISSVISVVLWGVVVAVVWVVFA